MKAINWIKDLFCALVMIIVLSMGLLKINIYINEDDQNV